MKYIGRALLVLISTGCIIGILAVIFPTNFIQIVDYLKSLTA
jgi:hypothetical protein